MIPFMSKYRLSNSVPFGFGCEASTGTKVSLISKGFSSTTWDTILGYFDESQLV
jgi:hypothetical protein